MADKSVCKIDGCDKPVKVKLRGWCNAHYHRWVLYGDPERGGPLGPAKGYALEFFENVVLTYEGDECLIWPYYRNYKGYGTVRYKNRQGNVHRFACIEANGPPPSPLHEAAHSCGNGRLGCCNPNHLSWKTPVENNADKIIHGTVGRGERNSQAKLTEDDILGIRSLGATRSQSQIAKLYGVSQTTVSQIQRGVRWAWLE